MALPEEIFCDNDLPISVGPLNVKSFLTGVLGLGTGLTVKAMIAATSDLPATEGTGGTPIHASLVITLTESGTSAEYFGGWDGALLTAHLLPTYKDDIVSIIVWSGQDFRVAGTVTVRAVRPLDTP